MKIYCAGGGPTYGKLDCFTRQLKSYYLTRTRPSYMEHIMRKKQKLDLFIDSGAYSAMTQQAVIKLDDYIAFIQQYKDHLTLYANLDVIGDPVETLRNQNRMEAAGLSPLPCFHFGEPVKYLKYYLDRYEYIAFGGMVGRERHALKNWLDEIWSDYILDRDGFPRWKIHGFGLTSLPFMIRYPWYSVDSTSWVMGSRMGSIFLPKIKNGKYDYVDAHKCCVSDRREGLSEKGQSFQTLGRREREQVVAYVESLGFKIGVSEYKDVPADYKLQPGEYWFDKGKRIGIIIEKGAMNWYMTRDQINVEFFKKLEKQLPQYPRQVKLRKRGLL